MAEIGISAPAPATASMQAPRLLLVGVVALFFIWGGITSLNDVLIPKLKDLFRLSYAQAMLIQFAFFTAYAVVSLPAGNLVARLGYGRGIVAGLSIMGLGCLLFVPAASTASYALFLGALFILAGGITILQVAANPLIANLGTPESSHSRLTLAQAFNSLGTTVMPFLGAQLILGSIAQVDSASLSGTALAEFQAREAAVVGHSYLGLSLVLLAIAGLFWLWRDHLGGTQAAASLAGSLTLLRRRARLAFGVVAIFLYVGAEVTIGSFLVNYLMLPSTLGLSERSAGEHISLYWGGALVGRFIGAWLLRRIAAGRLLAAVAIGAATLAVLSVVSRGPLAAWSLIAVGLMNAIMFPTIFSLAVERMGVETPRASGLLCMAIVGGAIVPLLAGAVADASSIAGALIVPAACYVVIAGFGWHARRPAQPYAPS
jgi:FHS family L-fucose permease-like MFS transporter